MPTYYVWAIGGYDKFFNSCIQEEEHQSYDDACNRAIELSAKHGAAGINILVVDGNPNQNDSYYQSVAYYEHGKVVTRIQPAESGLLPKARVNLDTDDYNLTDAQQQWIDYDVYAERESVEAILEELEWIARIYPPIVNDDE